MVAEHLKLEGLAIIQAFDGNEALRLFREKSIDLVLLDLMLPGTGGMDVLQVIRTDSTVPILIMSAKNGDVDKAIGLGFGADDYIAKPFSMIELTARVKAAIRRATRYSGEAAKDKAVQRIGKLLIDQNNFTVTKDGEVVPLTAKEFQILALFARYPGRVFSKGQLYSAIWEDPYLGDENVINVHIRRLREKIEDDPSSPVYIKTLWGIGYRLGELGS
ncbi:winged helix-turn-helix domain-containing protein [Paenibacillus sp. CAU 1782]